jgi:hypothetical protein
LVVPVTSSVNTLTTHTETPPDDNGRGAPWKTLRQRSPEVVQSASALQRFLNSISQCGPVEPPFVFRQKLPTPVQMLSALAAAPTASRLGLQG